jgi:hypothetical protein
MELWTWKRLSILLLWLFPYYLDGQNITVEPIVVLPDEVRESSGLIFINDRIITHNDDGAPLLYELDPDNGAILRKLFIDGASNIDWEDLCIDQQFMYIGDIGNSHGTRKDLRIYRVSLDDYFQSTNDTVAIDTIQFSYADQASFDDDTQTNFDAAAMISFGDSLYVFTKNWGDFYTNVYSIPKTPGDYQINRIGRTNSLGLVAGAVHNTLAKEIMLIGYAGTGPFLYRISEFEGANFMKGAMERISFILQGSFQVEGIEAINETDYYITSESNVLGEATLYRIKTDFVVGINGSSDIILQYYPNPTSRLLNIAGLPKVGKVSISLINTLGENVFEVTEFAGSIQAILSLDLSSVPEGIYQLKVSYPGKEIFKKLVIAQTSF